MPCRSGAIRPRRAHARRQDDGEAPVTPVQVVQLVPRIQDAQVRRGHHRDARPKRLNGRHADLLEGRVQHDFTKELRKHAVSAPVRDGGAHVLPECQLVTAVSTFGVASLGQCGCSL